MMIIAIIILSIISLFFAFAFILTRRKYTKLNSDIAKIIIAIKRMRYGDISVRVENLNDSVIESTINRLFETINDRELMIKEYQTNLSKKNVSLKKTIEQEEKLKHYKEEVIATLTHDMKVPVIAELNSINFLLENRFGELNDKQKEALNLMKSSNQELKDLIESILETYKLEESKFELDKKEVLLSEFIDNVIQETEPIALDVNHKIISEKKDIDDLKINIDEFQIKRVLKNLISNAVSYAQAGSDVKVCVEKDGSEVLIKVVNMGESITEEEINLIFNKYYSGSSKYRKTSTGLGLFISKQIAMLHGGDLKVDNSQEGYTSFILNLPIE